jgi:regulation of enolase protein 1 (concanavalin A-like superfamily)
MTTTFVGGANGVYEVMELAYDSNFAKQLELFEQRCGSELSFEHTDALAVQSSFDEQVYDMACAAYVTIQGEVDVGMRQQ